MAGRFRSTLRLEKHCIHELHQPDFLCLNEVHCMAKKAVKKPVKKTPSKIAAAKPLSTAKFAVEDQVPEFKALATSGDFNFSDYRGKNVVLYFYPKDATPGCTQEGLDFAKLYPKFKNNGTEVIGVSRDSLKSHENFKTKQKFPVPLASDGEEEMCQLFGVIKMKNMYGRQVRGIERSTFVIDKNGVLRREWRGVRVPGHAEEVLEFVKSLK
jgi:thioredoxin-dependent peroxiredoxin